jgi:hypothetical protein
MGATNRPLSPDKRLALAEYAGSQVSKPLPFFNPALIARSGDVGLYELHNHAAFQVSSAICAAGFTQCTYPKYDQGFIKVEADHLEHQYIFSDRLPAMMFWAEGTYFWDTGQAFADGDGGLKRRASGVSFYRL